MKPEVSRLGTAAAVGLALALSLASGGTLQARQDPPAQQPAQPPPQDLLKFSTTSPVLIVGQIKPDRVADFESAWAMIRAEFAKTDRPEVKEFAATLGKFYKVNFAAPPAGSPPPPTVYIFQIDSPSTTQSYLPGKIIYELLYFIKEGKEGGIPRATADEIFKKLDGAYANLAPWPLEKIGS
jgi:hypothetical protein